MENKWLAKQSKGEGDKWESEGSFRSLRGKYPRSGWQQRGKKILEEKISKIWEMISYGREKEERCK